jgi:hypothetical protein
MAGLTEGPQVNLMNNQIVKRSRAIEVGLKPPRPKAIWALIPQNVASITRYEGSRTKDFLVLLCQITLVQSYLYDGNLRNN